MFQRSRYDDHISRKFFHIISGSIVAYLFVSTLTRLQSIVLVVGLGSLFVLVDLLRLKWPALNRVAMRVFRPLMREDEDERPSSQLYYVLGIAWAIIALPRPIAIHAILCLAWMDPVAAIYGIRFGRRSWEDVYRGIFKKETHTALPESLAQKTVEGSFAGFLAAFFAGIVAWTGPWSSYFVEGQLHWVDPVTVFALACAGALAAVVAEAWPSQWDDNASIPFWTGLCVWVLASVIGIPLSYM